jgi:general secretion pathway protein L
MLEEIIIWWAGQMRDLLCAWPTRRPAQQPDALVLVAESSAGFETVLRHGRRERKLGHFSLDPAALQRLATARRALRRNYPVMLRLPAHALLERDVVLPLAVERDLARVLQYDMDKWTPFAAQDIAWSWKITRRDHQQARLHVQLALVQKTLWEPLVAALGLVGIQVAALEFAGPPPRRIALPHATATQAARRRLLTATGALCCVLAVAAIAVPFVRQSLARDAVEARIAALRIPAARVQALRQRVTGSSTANGIVAAERARSGDMLQILADITDLLPDDTFLTDLSVQARQITLAGQSAAAARLIPALSATSAIRDATFAAPVTRSATGATDSFSIRAQVAP